MSVEVSIFLTVFLSIIIGYLIGSIMFADIFGYFLKKNPRNYGSFNPGATNSIRVFGKKYGFIVGFLDILKGFVPFILSFIIFKFWLSNFITPGLLFNQTYYLTYLSSFFAVIGHAWPVFFKFKGGKAVAPTCGLLIAVSVWWFLILAIVWWSITLITKYVSLSSLVCFALLPIINLIPYLDYLHWFNIGKISYLSYASDWYIIVYFEIIVLILNGVVFYKHRANIVRLINKKESKITDKLKNGK